MSDVKNLRQMSEVELRSALEDAKTELFNLRFQRAAGKLENTSRMRVVRKQIARISTLLRERELAATVIQREDKNG